MAKPKTKSQPLTYGELFQLGSIALFVLILFYYLYRRATAASRKYKQTNPYVATVDLQERYGGLEKRQVRISDLPTEQLQLLERDGKLTLATIEKLRKEGKLPDPNNPGSNRARKSAPSTVSAPVSVQATSASVREPAAAAPKKRKGGKKSKK